MSGWKISSSGIAAVGAVALAWSPIALGQEAASEAAPQAAEEEVAPAEGEAAEQAEPDAPEAERRPEKGIEEIVVTARKREETVQETPIAISAFSAADLEDANIEDVSDIQFNVPNVTYTKTNFTGSSFSIRGIGALVVAASGDAGTGVHVNNVPINGARIFETEFFDVERVEVLRGPQGTLYGRNSPAGTINVITRKPEETLGGYLNAQYADYDSIKFQGALNVPLTEDVGLRLAGYWLDRDGYTKNIHTGNYIDDRELWGFRATLGAALGDNTDATLMVSWFDEDDNRSRMQKQACVKDDDRGPYPFTIGCSPEGLDTEAINGAATLATLLGFAIPGYFPEGVEDLFQDSINPSSFRDVNAIIDPEYTADEFISMLELNHHWRDLTFTSSTSFAKANVWSQTDYFWTVPSEKYGFGEVFIEFPGSGRSQVVDSEFVFDESSATTEQWSQELRVTSDFDGRLNFTLGTLFLNYEWSGDYFVYFSAAELFTKQTMVVEGVSLYDLEPRTSYYRNETRPYALDARAGFGEVYFDLTPTTRLTAGARLTHEKKKVEDRVNLLTFPLNDYDRREESWTEWTGKVGIDQTVDLPFAEALLYATYSTGYKGGGFNPPIDPQFNVPPTFEPEEVDSYELGMKSLLLDSRLLLNLTGFYYDYEGFQISKIVARTSVNENIDAEIYGAELEASFQPVAGLRFDLGGSWLDTEIQEGRSIDPANPTAGVPGAIAVKDFVALNGSNAVIPPDGEGLIDGYETNLRGKELANAPEWTLKVGGQYTLPMSLPLLSDCDVTFRVDHYWQDDMYGRIFNLRRDEIDSWNQTDAQIRIEPLDRPWTFELWVKNIADNDDVTGMYLTDATSANFTNLFILEPRIYGVTVGYRFD